jgi:hypothetical protein
MQAQPVTRRPSPFWTIAPLALLGSAMGIGLWAWVGHAAEMTPAVRGLTVLLFGALALQGLLGALGSDAVMPRAQMVLVLSVMGVLAALITVRAILGYWPFAWDGIGNPAYAGMLAVMLWLTIAGLLRRALWARWSGLAFGVTTLWSGVLNAPVAIGRDGAWVWEPVLTTLCGASIWFGLAAPAVRAHFASGRSDGLWTSSDRLVRIVRLAAIANLFAAPLLLCYAILQPIILETRVTAVLLAPMLVAGFGVVAVSRKTAGVLMLGVAGLGLLAQSMATCILAYRSNHEPFVAMYYTAFWLPAGVLGIAASALTLARARNAEALKCCPRIAGASIFHWHTGRELPTTRQFWTAFQALSL